MEKKSMKEEGIREIIKEDTGMTFEQIKDKYNYHYDRITELRHAYGFMNCNMYTFLDDKKSDGLMIMLKATKYLTECIDLECKAFGYIYTSLWGRWDTDNYDLDHEIHNLYELASDQEAKAKELLERIDDMCGEACRYYLSNIEKFTNEDKYNAMKAVLDYPKYHFDIPEKPKDSVVTYPHKYPERKEK